MSGGWLARMQQDGVSDNRLAFPKSWACVDLPSICRETMQKRSSLTFPQIQGRIPSATMAGPAKETN
jgi:hypothetical protein